MEKMTDWIMVIITGIYVIATIVICKLNYEQIKLSQKQIEEMEREHNENFMFHNSPLIELEIVDDDKNLKPIEVYMWGDNNQNVSTITFAVKNVGKGIAKDIELYWLDEKKVFFRFNHLVGSDRMRIRINLHYEEKIVVPAIFQIKYLNVMDETFMQMALIYMDYNEKKLGGSIYSTIPKIV